jgi:hypothetical protein
MIGIDNFPNRPHRLAVKLAKVVYETGTIEPDDVAGLKYALDRIQDPDELFHAALSIAYLALTLKQMGQETPHRVLARLLRSISHRTEHMKNEVLAQFADREKAEARNCAARFGRAQAPMRAPKMDAKAPPGTARVSAMMPRFAPPRHLMR